MGWRLRNTKSFGGFRTTFSKKGVGYSYGIPGSRFGISPDGRRFFSFGFPGTGFYFIKYFKKKSEKPKQQQIVPSTQIIINQSSSMVNVDKISKKF
jgi:hypothetical protein